ncbi:MULTISPECIES: putative Ig domain-containing protein [unclassified Nocardioides]|uniref:putative Ig domain-containing protein n=1 Tax=unclassified Nocardioides TaxID=2615069 RepID=UPI001F16BF7A|nr:MULTISPECIES: putative Ig domain-containing protein [unclassified Nocardioides]
MSRSTFVPKTGVVTGTDVAWVTSADPAGGEAPEGGPWLVGIRSGGAIPVVGGGYYLPADNTAFPGGLAGKVTGISSQADDITAVTVTAAPLDEIADRASATESGPGLGTEVTSAPAARRPANARRAEGALSFNFPKMTGSFFNCQNTAGQTASFGGSVNLAFANTRHDFSFDKGSPLFGVAPYVSAWIRTDVTVTGKISASAKITCSTSEAWERANEKDFLVGQFLIKVQPTASFSISAGTNAIVITQTTRRMVGFSVFNNRPTIYNTKVNLGTRVDAGDMSVKVEASAGIQTRVLWLGALGGQLQILLSISGKVVAKANPRQACVNITFGVKFVGNLVVDLWVKNWKIATASVFAPIITWDKCTAPTSAIPVTDDPAITTVQLPNARRNSPYDTTLQTADGRDGTWGIDTSHFPQGLNLSFATGEITGSPTAGVGTYRFTVTFTDTTGRQTSAVVTLYVGPALVGGGDFQATLTWGHYADMDLHVTDPAGEEIYYGNRTSDSGGQLDRDANAGCGEQNPSPVENVYWPPNGAPVGTYAVQVVTWSACGTVSQPWHLTVRVRGAVVLDISGNGTSAQYEVNVGNGLARVVGHHPSTSFKRTAKPTR